ncbi:MAG: hypothetical protein ACTJHH_09980, partial [Vagococcus salmoninarum]
MKSQSSIWEMLQFVFKRVLTQWQYIVISIIALVSIAFFEFSLPQITQKIIDEVIPQQSVSQLINSILLLLLFASCL